MIYIEITYTKHYPGATKVILILSGYAHLPESDPEVLRQERVQNWVDAAVHVRQHVRRDLCCHR